MTNDLQKYLTMRQTIINAGGSNSYADDVKDAFVEISMNKYHLTDDHLTQLLISYRNFETANPEYVQRGDALIA